MRSIFVSILFWCSFTPANDVSVRLDIDGPLKTVPVMDQDGKQFCYAYATAQLIDAYRFSHGDGRTDHITSPVKLAVDASAIDRQVPGGNSSRTDPNYMFPWNAIEAAKKYGSCNHLKIRDNFPDGNLEKYIDTIKSYHSQIEEMARLQWSRDKMEPVLEQCSGFINRNTGVTLTADQIYSALSANNPIEALEKYYKIQCSENIIPISLPDYSSYYKVGFSQKGKLTSDFSPIIEKALNDKIPLGIVYCQNILKEKNYPGITSPGLAKSDCIYHVSTIIGMRKTSSKTEFLIRDSYGISCLPYSQRECERGQIWITKEELEKNATHIYNFN